MMLEERKLSDVRTPRDFINARIVFIGDRTVANFCRKHGIKPPTIYRMINAKNLTQLRSFQETREIIAKALGFDEWYDLVKAWEADDVRAGLEDKSKSVTLEIPSPDFSHLEAIAKSLGLSVEQYAITRLREGDKAIIQDSRATGASARRKPAPQSRPRK